MPSKHYDLDIAEDLGGETPKDYYISSQKATKNYIDKNISQLEEKVETFGIIFRTYTDEDI